MKYRNSFKGQTLVLVAGGIVALFLLVALAFDGGSAMLQRSRMQNAADSGALAGVQIMISTGIAVSCNPAPCHPTHLATTQVVTNRVESLVSANRGNTVGDATYSPSLIEYHFMGATNGTTLAPDCSLAGARADASRPGACYRDTANYAPSAFVPAYVDGIAVTARVNNPTTFARVFTIDTIPVNAQSAALIHPSCPSAAASDDVLPFTRFRPPIEAALPTAANDLCHPFTFWNSDGDVQSNPFKNAISLNMYSFHQDNTQQLIGNYQNWDERYGVAGGLGNFNHANANPPYDGCPTSCADMRGLGAAASPPKGSENGTDPKQDLGNWIFWQWHGRLLLDSVYPTDTGTRYPASRNNNGGQTGSVSVRPGDWLETYSGNQGQNIQEPVHDLARLYGKDYSGISPPEPDGLNWGKGIDKTVYLWGEATVSGSTRYTDTNGVGYTVPNDTSIAQAWQTDAQLTGGGCNGNPPNPGPCYYTGWEDLTISVDHHGRYSADLASYLPNSAHGSNDVDRVRVTRAVRFVFFENLAGGSGQSQPVGKDPTTGASCPISTSGSQVLGVFLLKDEGGPGGGGGTCTTWNPLGGVYGGLAAP